MNVFAEILFISIIGMAATMAILSIFAGLFYLIGKFEARKERDEELLPFIATAVYLYFKGRSK